MPPVRVGIHISRAKMMLSALQTIFFFNVAPGLKQEFNPRNIQIPGRRFVFTQGFVKIFSESFLMTFRSCLGKAGNKCF